MGDAGIVAGQVKKGDVAPGAVDGEPEAELPDPVRVRGGGQGVVDAEGLTDCVAGFGDEVDGAGGPFGDAAVDDEGADLDLGMGGGGCVWIGREGDGVLGAKEDGVDDVMMRTGGLFVRVPCGYSGGGLRQDQQQEAKPGRAHGLRVEATRIS